MNRPHPARRAAPPPPAERRLPIACRPDKIEHRPLLFGPYFAWKGQLYKIGPEELAGCLWSDGRAEAWDVAWAKDIIAALTAKITGNEPEKI